MQASRLARGQRNAPGMWSSFGVSQRMSVRRRMVAQCRADTGRVPVRFCVPKEVAYGQRLFVVGNLPELGGWDAGRGLKLKWHEGHVWAAEAQLGIGERVEFKVVRVGDGGTEWEGGDNRELKIIGEGFSLDVHCRWGETRARDVRTCELGGGVEPFPPLAQAVSTPAADSRGRSGNGTSKQRRSGASGSSSPTSTRNEASASPSLLSSAEEVAAPAWQGREVRFMRSNEHSRERAGTWDASGLAPGPVLDLVTGDERAPNWLAKLGVAQHLLVDAAPRMRPEADSLAAALVYLSWVNSGAIPCVEGGGHHRPNHHARTAQQIFRSLEWAIEDDGRGGGLAPRVRTLLARRLHARLPSFDASFTQSVPLTRIRDIAHRGDIPHDLKQEIKHTLQNKLHRNAGPEDLVATQAMLARITATPGEYPAAFVAEFRTFAAELRDFFNAAPLTSTLEGLRDVLASDPADAQVLDAFLAAKAKLDTLGDAPPLSELMGVVHAATTLRALLLAALRSGLRNDAPDAALSMRQRFRLAEVRCEEFVFVTMSRFINGLEAQGGSGALAAVRSDIAWSHPLAMLLLGVRNIGLGGWMLAECAALEAEVTAWQQDGAYSERDNALRLKATLERCLRLTTGYTDALLGVLPRPASQLGAALGVGDWAVRTFTEGEVRSSLVFQLSKLAATLLVAARALGGVTPWDALVAGTAVGTLRAADRLEPGALGGSAGPTVLLVREADGDEEVGAAGPSLRGVILAQALPHLSHLGVRARQERVPFVTLEDRDTLAAEVEPLVGQVVALVASPEGVTLRPATPAEAAAAASAAASGSNSSGDSSASSGVPLQASPLRVSKAASAGVLALPDCDASRVGAKAAACAQLERVAASGGFRTPPGVAVPFGTMELAVDALPAGERERYQQLLARAETAPVEELDAVCTDLQALVAGLRVPDAVLRGVAQALPPGSPLIARSSANVEDLAGLSGAGLYDSVPNVPPGDPAALSAAISRVWASLYTRRAVLSRRAARVPQANACMAVLVQALLAPSLSFVLHTASPLGDAPGTAVAEVAVGLGETLASGQRGSAWRLAVDKARGDVSTLAFANFSTALVPASAPAATGAALEGGRGSAWGSGLLVACAEVPLDYSAVALSRSADARRDLGSRLGRVAALLEGEFGGPQDVEGCCVGDAVYVVQTRPQPL